VAVIERPEQGKLFEICTNRLAVMSNRSIPRTLRRKQLPERLIHPGTRAGFGGIRAMPSRPSTEAGGPLEASPMPYARNEDLPASVRDHLPPPAQDIFRAIFARADRLEAEAKRARALLDRLESAILAKAFRGELVPQDPDDEPASVLLARIHAQRAASPKRTRARQAAARA
jgi:cation transport regulator ChaB